MEKSESIKNLSEAFCKFQGSMEAIRKDSTNPFFKSRYASLGAIIEDTRKELEKNGLSYVQFPSGEYGLETMLMHTSGEWMKATYTMKPVDQKPQSLGSALTYQRRYALCAILGLQVEDDDANEASKPQKQSAPTVQSAPKASKTPAEVFEDAKMKIDACETQEQLETLMGKIGEYKRFTEDQKEQIGLCADDRLSIINAK